MYWIFFAAFAGLIFIVNSFAAWQLHKDTAAGLGLLFFAQILLGPLWFALWLAHWAGQHSGAELLGFSLVGLAYLWVWRWIFTTTFGEVGAAIVPFFLFIACFFMGAMGLVAWLF